MQASRWFARVGVVAVTMCAAWTLPAQAADVGVSVSISQPGVYGRVDIGRFPNPVVVVPQPVVIQQPVVVQRPPTVVVQPVPVVQPVYMWVPPGHRKNWRKHCGKYGACGVPVYFVQDRWYHSHVKPQPAGYHGGSPAYRERGDDDRGHGHGNGHGHGRGHGRGGHD